MLRGDGSMAASVVNAGVMPHPLTGGEVVAYVARGTKKPAHLRGDPRRTAVARSGWRWAAVEGTAGLLGPADTHPEIDAERLRLLLREVFTAAGGGHDDWEEYDKVMRDERSAAVLVAPSRSYPTA